MLSMHGLVLSLLLGVFLLQLSVFSSLPLAADASGVDDHALYDPVTVRVSNRGQGSSMFNMSSGRNFLSEYRLGIVSYLRDYVGISEFSDLNIPLSTVTRVTDGGLQDSDVGARNETVWTFVLVFVSTAQTVSPLNVYSQFETSCDRQPKTGECNAPYYAVESAPVARQWLARVTSVNLVCCDGAFAQSLQGCTVCNARNFLPLILGCTLGFVGAVALYVAVKLYIKKRDRQRSGKGFRTSTAGVTDAGHKPPPQDLAPMFQVQPGLSSHRISHDGPILTAQRPAHIAHMPPVVDTTTQVIDIKLSAEENLGLGLGKKGSKHTDLEAGTDSKRGKHKHRDRKNSESQHRDSVKKDKH